MYKKLYRGIVKGNTNNPHPRFRFVVVDTVKELQDHNGNWYTESLDSYEDCMISDPDQIFYLVYGSFHMEYPQTGIEISGTDNLEKAINIAENIMGQKIESLF